MLAQRAIAPTRRRHLGKSPRCLGYWTGYVGKWHALTDIALDIIERRDDDRPRLLFVSYLEPHHQNNRYRTIGPKGWAARFAGYDVPADLKGRLGDWRWNSAEYLACCASIDANLGRIVDAIDDAGRLDDTLIVYSSDHGSHFRTRNLDYKRSAHDASIRVPLVVRGPGFRGGARCDSMVSNLDLVPTLVTAAGSDDPGLHGAALQRTLDGTYERSSVLVQISESQVGRALRTHDHTYSVRGHRLNPLAPSPQSASPRPGTTV